jgi:N-carbamoyl-L-amino-acid hydrolase
LEVLRTLEENHVHTRHPVGLVVFTNEEGARYTTDLMGSRAFNGMLTAEDVWSIRGTDGSLVGDELQRIGYKGQVKCGSIHPHAYLELHVEQGPHLESSGIPIGVVEAITGITWLEVTVKGVANHAGTTPMNQRRDAGLAGARMAALLPELADRIPGLRATCGCFSLLPGMINVIAQEARFTVDLRHADLRRLAEAENIFTANIQEIARLQAVSVDTVTLGHVDPQTCDPFVVNLLEDTCRVLEYSFQRMVSGAGHDAQAMASICPAAMVFIPSKDGVSHSPAEYSNPEDLERGVNVLLQAALQLAQSEK